MKHISTVAFAGLVLAALLTAPLSVSALTQDEDCHTTYLSSRQVEGGGAEPTIAYENLTEHQQQVVRRTLNESEVAVSAETMQNLDGTSVRYEGSYYLMEAGHAECNTSPIPMRRYGLVGFVALVVLAAVGFGYRSISKDEQ